MTTCPHCGAHVPETYSGLACLKCGKDVDGPIAWAAKDAKDKEQLGSIDNRSHMLEQMISKSSGRTKAVFEAELEKLTKQRTEILDNIMRRVKWRADLKKKPKTKHLILKSEAYKIDVYLCNKTRIANGNDWTRYKSEVNCRNCLAIIRRDKIC